MWQSLTFQKLIKLISNNHRPYKIKLYLAALLLSAFACFTACRVRYGFNDASIDPSIKTVKIGYIDNKARYINPQLSQKLTDKVQQKITTGTKLTRTNVDTADYVINGVITTYDGTQTVGVSAQAANTNRLTVSVHITLRKTKENKTEEFDVSRSFDYAATLAFSTAEAQLLDEVVRSLTDDIFNRIFSNW